MESASTTGSQQGRSNESWSSNGEERNYVKIFRSSKSKEESLLFSEAGADAVSVFVESCLKHFGEENWLAEANKLWRKCVKISNKKKRSAVHRGDECETSAFGDELRGVATRLYPVTNQVSETSSSSTTAADLRRCSNVLLGNTKPDKDGSLDELQSELRLLKWQLSRQVEVAQAREAEIKQLREAKYQLCRGSSHREAQIIQTRWRSKREARRYRLVKSASTLCAKLQRGRSTRQRYAARVSARKYFAACKIQRIQRNRKKRAAAAVKLQRVARYCVKYRCERLRHAVKSNESLQRKLRDSSGVCPLSQSLIKNPVVCFSDGYVYEAEPIRDFVDRNKCSPMTKKPVSPRDLVVRQKVPAAYATLVAFKQVAIDLATRDVARRNSFEAAVACLRVDASLDLLQFLSSSSEESATRPAMLDAGLTEALLMPHVLRPGRSFVTQTHLAACILERLSRENPEQVLRAGAVPILVKLLKTANDVLCKQQVAKVLAELHSRHKPEEKQQMEEEFLSSAPYAQKLSARDKSILLASGIPITTSSVRKSDDTPPRRKKQTGQQNTSTRKKTKSGKKTTRGAVV